MQTRLGSGLYTEGYNHDREGGYSHYIWKRATNLFNSLFHLNRASLTQINQWPSLSFNQFVALSHIQLIMTLGFNNSWGICWGHTLLGFSSSTLISPKFIQ